MTSLANKCMLCSWVTFALLASTQWYSTCTLAGGIPDGDRLALLQQAQGDEPRRSPEAEARDRRSPEAESQRRQSPEEEARRALQGFRPQTEREAALYRMILQLQREVAQLRREMQALASTRERPGERDSEVAADARARDREPGTSREPSHSQLLRVFKAYDKDDDEQVSFAEFLAMREGADNPRVRAQAQQSFQQVDRDGNGLVSFEEYTAAGRRRQEGDQPRREGDQPRRDADPPRERDRPRDEGDRPRDGEDQPRGARDRDPG
jgi:hypothetical protein